MTAKKEGFLKATVDAFTSSALRNIKRGVDDLIDKAQRKVLRLQERMLNRLAVALLMLLAFLFFLGAVLYFLVQNLELQSAYAYAIVGFLLLLFAFLLRYRGMRSELRG